MFDFVTIFFDNSIRFLSNLEFGIRSIDIFIPKNIKYKDLINYKGEYIKQTEEIISLCKKYSKNFSKDKEKYKSFIDNFEDIINFPYEVKLNCSLDDAIEYIKNNPELIEHNILIKADKNTSTKQLKEIKELFKNKLSNVKFEFFNSRVSISYGRLYKTIEYLENLEKRSEEYNFSPIESIMYYYDNVRSKKYLQEDKNETPEKSRDIVPALLGDKIVCVGYVNILMCLLARKGIKADYFYLTKANNKYNGHARLMAYIKDDKYGIDGVYCFDPTWEAYRGNSNYLYFYLYFGKTIDEMKQYSKEYNNDGFNDFNEKKYINYLNKLVKLKEKNECNIQLSNDNKIKLLNDMNFFVYREELVKGFNYYADSSENFSELIKNSMNIIKKLSSPISHDVLMKILCNVRKYEYFEDPSKYPYSKEDLIYTAINSKWDLPYTPEERLLSMIFGESFDKENDINHQQNRASSFLVKNDEPRTIQGVKLARTLTEVLNKKR